MAIANTSDVEIKKVWKLYFVTRWSITFMMNLLILNMNNVGAEIISTCAVETKLHTELIDVKGVLDHFLLTLSIM